MLPQALASPKEMGPVMSFFSMLLTALCGHREAPKTEESRRKRERPALPSSQAVSDSSPVLCGSVSSWTVCFPNVLAKGPRSTTSPCDPAISELSHYLFFGLSPLSPLKKICPPIDFLLYPWFDLVCAVLKVTKCRSTFLPTTYECLKSFILFTSTMTYKA